MSVILETYIKEKVKPKELVYEGYEEMSGGILVEASLDLEVNYHQAFVEQLSYELNEESTALVPSSGGAVVPVDKGGDAKPKGNIFKKIKEALVNFFKAIGNFFKTTWKKIVNKFSVYRKVSYTIIESTKGKHFDMPESAQITGTYYEPGAIKLLTSSVDTVINMSGPIEMGGPTADKTANIEEALNSFKKEMSAQYYKAHGHDILTQSTAGIVLIEKALKKLDGGIKKNIDDTSKLISECDKAEKSNDSKALKFIENGKSKVTSKNVMISKIISAANKITLNNLSAQKGVAKYYVE